MESPICRKLAPAPVAPAETCRTQKPLVFEGRPECRKRPKPKTAIFRAAPVASSGTCRASSGTARKPPPNPLDLLGSGGMGGRRPRTPSGPVAETSSVTAGGAPEGRGRRPRSSVGELSTLVDRWEAPAKAEDAVPSYGHDDRNWVGGAHDSPGVGTSSTPGDPRHRAPEGVVPLYAWARECLGSQTTCGRRPRTPSHLTPIGVSPTRGRGMRRDVTSGAGLRAAESRAALCRRSAAVYRATERRRHQGPWLDAARVFVRQGPGNDGLRAVAAVGRRCWRGEAQGARRGGAWRTLGAGPGCRT